ncbi:hypothetical protein ACJX0J_014122, partial [Zea mays]
MDEAHVLLAQDQRLTHMALVQEVAAARRDLGCTAHELTSAHEESDQCLHESRGVYERSMKMEVELRAVHEMRAELAQVRMDIQNLGAMRQELMGQVQGLTQDLAQSAEDLHKVSALQAETQEIKHETQHLRSGIELEKKGYAQSYEQGQDMQIFLFISVASFYRTRYIGSYGNPKANYAANPFNSGYGINQ